MFGKDRKKESEQVSRFGGLDEITDEEIDQNIKDYPYVLGKLKKC